jgi:DNA polymerase-3 subunit gamma/tau
VSYLVLARKWRPQTFSDLVGQEHVSRTLANAIQSGRVAHAFLFTGVRGVGKTTSARIMAKALNCEKGPTATPCLVCSACREIASGADVDVQEIDGASYNGVDEVRRLQESLPYRPARDRFKIFIVDEVHMLSQNAWNAFLKTLEEPPPHVKFIFATTEVHKVPITILSRCQRYDFKLIPTTLIAARLKYVLEQEKIQADEGAVALIAREGAGSMRDAMSLLDQAIAWGGEKLVGEEVAGVLGVASRHVLHEVARALLAGDAAECLRVLAKLAEQGFDMTQVARGILATLRDLVVAKVCAEPGPLLDLSDDEAREVKELAAPAAVDDLSRLYHGFSKPFDDVVRSAQPRSSLEMLLVRLAQRPPLLPIDDLLARLSDLERRLSSGSPPQGPTRSPPGNRPPNPGGSGPVAGPPSAPAPSAISSGVAPTRASAETAPKSLSSVVPPRAAAPSTSPMSTSSISTSPMSASASQSTAPASASAAQSMAPRVDVAPASAPPLPSAKGLDLAAWRAILQAIRAENAPLAAVLEHASPIHCNAERVVLGYEPGSFLAMKATETAAVERLTRHVRAYFGAPAALAFDLTAGPRSTPSVASLDNEERKKKLEQARRTVAEHPLVRAAVEVLGAELSDVRLPE